MSLIRLCLFGGLLTLLTACTSLSLQDRDNTPREIALVMKREVGPLVRELAQTCELGLMTAETQRIIADYAPAIRTSLGTYAATARACVVVDGALQTDPLADAPCGRGSLRAASASLPDVLKQLALGIGGTTGNRIYLVASAASLLIGRGDGGLIDGFKKVEDIPLDFYDAAWRPVQADADRLLTCVTHE